MSLHAGRAEERKLEFAVKTFFAGGIAGMCSKTSVAPLDRIKILLQAHNRHYKHLGVFSGLQEIIKRETFFALYKGNGAQMVRIFPYGALQFTSFEFYSKCLGDLFEKRSHIDKFLAGSCAGVTAVTFTYPLDIIRARLAFQVTGEHVYSGIAHAAASIFKEEGGIRALYRGFVPTIMGMMPYAGLSFYVFEKLKYLSMKYAPQYLCNKCDKNTGGLVLSLPAKFLCGGFAGAVAQTFSYPLDVTRRRMQLAMMNPDTHKYGSSMMSTLGIIRNENGFIKGLFRGMSVNYVRAVPMVAVSFTTYEIMKQLLNLDTGISV
ncbi:graves disease carrier protein [Orussus abietinus]|uniref:graves disease carrier protein n=1 Tax=Orussus abietinus TaxID=222816 RepID=UPI0006255377|nr:graves disease carrier protein [Orussus abietinus]XP_023288531.1 graves disease carrier protein [Orussus abietinus]